MERAELHAYANLNDASADSLAVLMAAFSKVWTSIFNIYYSVDPVGLGVDGVGEAEGCPRRELLAVLMAAVSEV